MFRSGEGQSVWTLDPEGTGDLAALVRPALPVERARSGNVLVGERCVTKSNRPAVARTSRHHPATDVPILAPPGRGITDALSWEPPHRMYCRAGWPRGEAGIVCGVRPPVRRRVAAIAIDAALLFLAGPILALVLGLALSTLLYLPVRGDCPEPCDGPGMLGFGLALTLLWLTWLLYWPLVALFRRRTLGARLLGLRYQGEGLRRHLAWDRAPET